MPEPLTHDLTADLPPVSDASLSGAPDRGGALAGGRVAAPDGYELLAEVGRGGMGVVHRARDTSLGRDVAVKLLQDRFPAASPAARRFLDEARITAQLQHPGIPPVHQVGTLADGRPFLAMKLIQGRTLVELLRERADLGLDRGYLLGVFEQVTQAVGYAHENRVLHRDLKPANVMVGAFGEVQVMDWGLAKVLRDNTSEADGPVGADIRSPHDEGNETGDGSVLGTPAYMPPEQARGAVDRIDERSDVFALGGILCAILTGKPPYPAPSSDSARRMAAAANLDDAFARLEDCRAEPELVALCKRCLNPEQAGRPANAGEVARAVAAVRAAADERARQAELDRVKAEGERAKAATEAHEQRKRRRVQLLLAVAVGLLLAGGGAFAWWQDIKARELAAAEESAEELETQYAMGRGRWREVIDRSERVLAAGRRDANRLRLRQVRAYQALGDSEADRVLERLDSQADLAPNERAEVDLLVGDGVIVRGDAAESRRRIERALAGDLPPADREYARGLLAESLDDALARQRAAIAFDPAHHGARSQLAYLLVLSGRWEEASLALTVAETLFPEDLTFVIVRLLHNTLRGEGVDLAAITQRLAAGLDPGATADLRLAVETLRVAFGSREGNLTDQARELTAFQVRLAQLAGRMNSGVAGLRLQALSFPPVFQKSFQVLAEAPARGGDPAYADELGAAARAWPDAILLKGWGDALLARKRPREAIAALKEAAAAPTIYLTVREHALNRNRLMAVVTVFQSADDKTRELLRPEIQDLVRNLLQTNRGPAARGLGLSIGRGQTLGWVMADSAWQAGYLDLARTVLQEWKTAEPDSPILHAELAVVEFFAKHHPEAIEAGRKAKALGLADPLLVRNVDHVLKTSPGELEKLARHYAEPPVDVAPPREVKGK